MSDTKLERGDVVSLKVVPTTEQALLFTIESFDNHGYARVIWQKDGELRHDTVGISALMFVR